MLLWSFPALISLHFVRSALAKEATASCTADSIPKPEYFGISVTSLQAQEVKDWGAYAIFGLLGPTTPTETIDFCNVTVTYTHPGLGDQINVYVWLPLDGWNGRFIAQGGGGWAAGAEGALGPSVQAGYAAVNTDAGHAFTDDFFKAATDASWALASPGNVDLNGLQNFASVALDDMAQIGKAITTSYYGKAPKYSYWNGCSTGGRQGMIQAQRFPKNFDGILAMAPAFNFDTFLIAEFWPLIAMKREGYYPPPCELMAIQKAAIEACDELDGVKDGVVAAQGSCDFDALEIVGQKYDCEGDSRKISKAAAKIANAIWEGPTHPTRRGWYGLAHEAPMAMPGGRFGLGQTLCDEKNKNCGPAAFPIAASWLKVFIRKDLDFDANSMTEEQFWGYLHISKMWYNSIVGTDDPDLSEFREFGGKMISWHGLADQLIFPNGSANYYDRVLEQDSKARDFFRYFEAPGVEHCMGGPGPYPGKAFDALVDWVEKGKAPEVLDAATVSMDPKASVKTRPLCQYPQVAAYIGGDPDEASSYKCGDDFGTKKASEEFQKPKEEL